MDDYQRVRVEFTGWTLAAKYYPPETAHLYRHDPIPHWAVVCPHGCTLPEYVTWHGLSIAHETASKHWKSCAALRLGRLLADLRDYTARAERLSPACDAEARTHKGRERGYWEGWADAHRAQAAEISALVKAYADV